MDKPIKKYFGANQIICTVLILLFTVGCGHNYKIQHLASKYSYDELVRVLTYSNKKTAILEEIENAFSEAAKDYVWEISKISTGQKQLKYLAIYLIFNEYFMNKIEYERIREAIINNSDNWEVLRLMDCFFIGCEERNQDASEELFETLFLLWKTRKGSIAYIFIIRKRYDLSKIEPLLDQICLDNLTKAYEYCLGFIPENKNGNTEETLYYKNFSNMLKKEVDLRLKRKFMEHKTNQQTGGAL